MSSIFGQDIGLDGDGRAKVAANGELILTDGVETGIQDILLRLKTYLGSLFYDSEFGGRLPDYIHDDGTVANRIGIENELVRIVQSDPRVVFGSVSGRVLKMNNEGVTAQVNWMFIGENNRLNLVLELESGKVEAVIKDVRTDSKTY
ncbi:MAG: baseplate assembly protein [Desulfovibrio sp.]